MIKILIADDHPVVRLGLLQIISDEKDMEVVAQASDGIEVLEMLRDIKVDLVILDIAMPKISGFEALAQIKVLYPKIPVLMLSVLSEELSGLRALKNGALGFLNKESSPEDLINSIRKVIAGKPSFSLRFIESADLNIWLQKLN